MIEPRYLDVQRLLMPPLESRADRAWCRAVAGVLLAIGAGAAFLWFF